MSIAKTFSSINRLDTAKMIINEKINIPQAKHLSIDIDSSTVPHGYSIQSATLEGIHQGTSH